MIILALVQDVSAENRHLNNKGSFLFRRFIYVKGIVTEKEGDFSFAAATRAGLHPALVCGWGARCLLLAWHIGRKLVQKWGLDVGLPTWFTSLHLSIFPKGRSFSVVWILYLFSADQKGRGPRWVETDALAPFLCLGIQGIFLCLGLFSICHQWWWSYRRFPVETKGI